MRLTARTLYSIRLITIGLLLAGCSDLSDAEPAERPDVSGSWTITLSGTPAAAPPGNGQCVSDPFRVQLGTRTRSDEFDSYSASHDAIRFVCSGITPLVTQSSGLRDTVMVSPVDTIQVQVWSQTCNSFGQCTDRRGNIFLIMLPFSLIGVPATPQMNGSFGMANAGGTFIVSGNWLAVKQ